MPAPLFLLIYFAFVTTVIGHPQEATALIAAMLILKILRHL